MWSWLRPKPPPQPPAVAIRQPSVAATPALRARLAPMLDGLAEFGIRPPPDLPADALSGSLAENGFDLEGEWAWWDLLQCLGECAFLYSSAKHPIGYRIFDMKRVEGRGAYVEAVSELMQASDGRLRLDDVSDEVDPSGRSSVSWTFGGNRETVPLDGRKWLDARLLEAVQARLAAVAPERFAFWGDGSQNALVCLRPDRIAALSALTSLDFETPAARA